MLPQIAKLFQRLERQKHALMCDLAVSSEAQLRFRPEPASWSTLEVIDHIIKVETELLADVQQQLATGASVTFRERFAALIVISVMLSPIRVKVPASSTAVLPDLTTDLPLLGIRWRDVRIELAKLLGTLQPEQLQVGLFRHPVSGWMTTAGALRFLSAHLQHHTYQLSRLKAAARKVVQA